MVCVPYLRNGATATGGTGGGGPSQPTTPGGKGYRQATQVKEQVQQAAAELKDQVTEQATGKVAEQRAAASGGLNTIAHAFRQTGTQLREQEQDGIAQYVDRAAGQIEHFGDYLGRRDLRGLAQDAERFARREPALFLGGAFTLGLCAARFLKSSGGGASFGQALPQANATSLALPATSTYQPPLAAAKPPMTPPPASPATPPSGSGGTPPLPPSGMGSRPSSTPGGAPRVGGPPASAAPPAGTAPVPGGTTVRNGDAIVGGPPREPGKEPRR